MLAACGISIEKQLPQLDGRILNAPTVRFFLVSFAHSFSICFDIVEIDIILYYEEGINDITWVFLAVKSWQWRRLCSS